VIAATAVATRKRLLLILLAIVGAGAIVQAFDKRAPTEPDRGALVTFCGLIVALAWLITIPGPGSLNLSPATPPF
jgi:hypothetical protein